MCSRLRVGVCLLAATLFLPAPHSRAAWREGGVPVCIESTSPQIQPAICEDGQGGAIVVWWDYRNGEDPDLYAQRIDADGHPLWLRNGVPICVQPGSQYAAAIVSNGAGGAVIAWHDDRSCEYCWDIYAQQIDSDGNSRWTVDGVLVCGAGEYQTYPEIVTDGHHGAIIAWADVRGYVVQDYYAQRIAYDGSLMWAQDGVPICTASGVQDCLAMVPDGSGGAYLVWEDHRTVGSSGVDIYGQGVASDGTPYWVANGVRICGAADDQRWPDIVTDGGGGVVLVWSDYRNDELADIYAQRLSPGGVPLWLPNGRRVCDVAGAQYSPRLVTDLEQGAVVTWRDKRGSSFDVYAQRVSDDGDLLWGLSGVIVCNAAGDQGFPSIVPDREGGAIIAWEDAREGAGEEDIYAQRLNRVGQAYWSDGGKAISAAPYGQSLVCLVQDAGCGAILAWQDFRSNESWDIYAQSTEFLPSAVEEVVPGPGSRSGSPDLSEDSYPNPFRALVSIPYRLPDAERVFLRVYDASGRLIRTIEGESPEAGGSVFLWDGRDASGQEAGSGTYFCCLKEGGREKIHKVIKVR